MSKKILWEDIYKDFRSKFPNFRKEVLGFRPHDYLTIKLWVKGGRKATYNYATKECRFISSD